MLIQQDLNFVIEKQNNSIIKYHLHVIISIKNYIYIYSPIRDILFNSSDPFNFGVMSFQGSKESLIDFLSGSVGRNI